MTAARFLSAFPGRGLRDLGLRHLWFWMIAVGSGSLLENGGMFPATKTGFVPRSGISGSRAGAYVKGTPAVSLAPR